MCSVFQGPLPNLNYQEDPVSKGCTHSISRTNKHSFCINYHFSSLERVTRVIREMFIIVRLYLMKMDFLLFTNLRLPKVNKLSFEGMRMPASRDILTAALGCWLGVSFVPAFCGLLRSTESEHLCFCPWHSVQVPWTTMEDSDEHQSHPHWTTVSPMPNDVARGLRFSEAECVHGESWENRGSYSWLLGP